MKLFNAIAAATAGILFIASGTSKARMNKECDAALEAAELPHQTITLIEKCLKIAPNDEQYAVMASSAFFELEQYLRAGYYANKAMAIAIDNNKRNEVYEPRWMGYGMFMFMQSQYQQFLEADNPSPYNWDHIYFLASSTRGYAGCPEKKSPGWESKMDPMLDKKSRAGFCVEAVAIQSAVSWFNDDYEKACPKAKFLASKVKPESLKLELMSRINLEPILEDCRDRNAINIL